MKVKRPQDLETLAEEGRKRLAQPGVRAQVGMSSCGLAAGAAEVFGAARSLAGENQGEITPVSTGCLGFCGAEPLLDITVPGKGRAIYGPVDAEKARELLTEALAKRLPQEGALGRLEPLAGGPGAKSIPDLAQHPFYKGQVKLVSRNIGQIDPSSLAEYVARGGYFSLAKALFTMSPEAVIAEIQSSGLRGRGGAGFPTGIKWAMVAREQGPKYLIMNGDEGDPGAYMDRTLMEGDPHAIIEGMAIGAWAMGAETGVLFVRAEYPLALERLKNAIRQAEEAGLLGDNIMGSKLSFRVFLVCGAGAFVSGEETALIASVEGTLAEPRPRPPYPAVSGLYGRPTCINNVETWANVPPIVSAGADFFAGYGSEKSKGTKLFCLVGDVERTGLVEVPLGTPLFAIVRDIGGGARGGAQLKAVQTGGPSGGCIPASRFDLPVDYENLAAAGSIMGSGGLVVMSERACMVDVARYFLEFTRHESCGKCTPCREGTEHLGRFLEAIAGGKGTQEDVERLEGFSKSIMAASLCGLGQTAPNPVVTTLGHFRDEYEAHVIHKRCPAGVCPGLVSYSIDPEACTGCGLCEKECPSEAIAGEKNEPHTLDAEKCVKCGACREVCAFDAVIVT